MIRLWRSPKQLKTFGVGENYFARGAVSPPPLGAASPSGVGLPTNSNGVGPITGEMRQFSHT